MSKVIVSKFGGTSMGTREAMLNAARIVHAKPAIRVVVVSATSGTTNQLIKIAASQNSREAFAEIAALGARHHELALSMNCDETQMDALEEIMSELSTFVAGHQPTDAKNLDSILAIGERLSSVIFTQALKSEKAVDSVLLDARDFLKTDSRFGKAEVDTALTREKCESLRVRLANSREIFVTQGFIGSDSNDTTTTLGRGGSDYSAAVFAEAIGASELEIWTDVPGILTMDPRVVPHAHIIPEIGFSEAAEMANFGAKVLHPATLWPAIRAAVPVFVGSTFQPEKGGTRVLPNRVERAPLIRAIAVRNQQTLITVSSLRMLNSHGFLAKMFDVLASHHLSVDLVTTSEVSVALTLDGTSQGSIVKKISEQTEMLEELSAFAEVKIEEGLSLVAIIGNQLNQAPGVAAKIFQAVSDFNIRLVCHGASEHNVCLLVNSSEANEVAKRLHEVCIEGALS